jgi:integrase
MGKTFRQMTKQDVTNYFDNLTVKPYTIEHRRIVITKFFKWLYDNENPDVVKDLEPNLNAYDKTIDPKSLWTDEEIKQLVKVCTHPRDKAMIMTLYDTGARIGELLSMNICDADFQGDTCSIFLRNSKTQRRRVGVLFSAPYLQEWIDCHPMKNNPDAPLWISLSHNTTRRGNRLKDNSAFDILKSAQKRSSVDKHLNPHLLRHSCISKCRKAGMPDSLIRRRVGLSPGSIVLERYTHISDDEVENSYRKSMGYKPKKPVVEDPEILKPKTCLRCSASNPVDAKFCHKCHISLDYESVERDLNILEMFKTRFAKGMNLDKMLNQYQQFKAETSDMQQLLDCFNGNDRVQIREVRKRLRLKDDEALGLLEYLATAELIHFDNDMIYLEDKQKFKQFLTMQRRYLEVNKK